ncbi:MAG: quinone-dependent dihydroorotate dehydrogenase [Rhodospirillales bacterium]|nr:quinone-dependent dihydroorotate dehydrogenase [Rhodospirillales bacterium]
MFDLYPLAAPFIRLLDPESGHRLAINALRCGLVPACGSFDDPALRVTLWGREFPNPIGTAAGFDKNAEAVPGTLAQGFGFVEIGTVTPRPQPGQGKPRLFRLMADGAVINRMGFNNDGLDAVLPRLSERKQGGIVGVNLGKNRDSEDAIADYVTGITRAAQLADFLVLNVSSPNTPGLRGLQEKGALSALLTAALEARNRVDIPRHPPLLVKVAPDLVDAEIADIADVCLSVGVDGVIATNTTNSRPAGLKSARAGEDGGLSGGPLFDLSTRVLGRFHELTQGKLPLIGVGGVSDGEQAYAKIRAGASLVQLYTAMVFKGPAIANRIKRDLAVLLKRDGFSTIAEAVGADHRASVD